MHKKEVAQAVEPILTQAEDDFIMTSLMTLQKTVFKIREKNVSDEIKAEELGILFEETERRGIVEFFLRGSENNINAIFDKSKIVLAGVLNTGISAKDFESNNVNTIIKRNIPPTTPKISVNSVSSVVFVST